MGVNKKTMRNAQQTFSSAMQHVLQLFIQKSSANELKAFLLLWTDRALWTFSAQMFVVVTRVQVSVPGTR